MATCVPDRITAIRAELQLGRSSPAAIVTRVDALLEQFPDSPDLWVLRGEAALMAGDHSAARTSFDRAFAIDPSHPGAAEGLRRVTRGER